MIDRYYATEEQRETRRRTMVAGKPSYSYRISIALPSTNRLSYGDSDSSATTNERNRVLGRIGSVEKLTIPGQTGSQDEISAISGEATRASKEATCPSKESVAPARNWLRHPSSLSAQRMSTKISRLSFLIHTVKNGASSGTFGFTSSCSWDLTARNS